MICKIKNCNKKSVKDELCRIHFIEVNENIFKDNSEPENENKGILAWLKYFYEEHYRDKFSNDHKEVYRLLLNLYDKRYKNKSHRLREIIAYRSFAKSKIIFGIISYVMAHNNQEITVCLDDGTKEIVTIKERLIVIFSETGGMSEEFVVNIRDEFSSNLRIKYFYSFTIRDAFEDDTGQWTRKAFKMNGLFLLGLGAGQQVRGKIRGAYRVTWAFFDDIYSENNVLTVERRNKLKTWFYNAAGNSIDDIEGKATLVGTIVNDDTVIVECEKSDTWETLKFYPMPIMKFKEFVKKHLKLDLDGDHCYLPFSDEEDKFKRINEQEKYFNKLNNDSYWGLTWKERMGFSILASKYKEAVEGRNISGFYQEYFHITIPSELKKFNTNYFQEIPGKWKINYLHGYNWLDCKTLYKKEKIINIEFGLDLSSGTESGDSVVIVVIGILANGKIFVLDISSGKYSMRDIMEEDDTNYYRKDKIIIDKSLIRKIGFIDEAFRLAVKYKPRIIKVGTGGGLEPTVVNEMRRVFTVNNLFVNITPRPQTKAEGIKIERIKNTLLPHYETLSVYHKKNLTQLEYELEFLGKASTDDHADALEVAVHNCQRPVDVNIDLFNQEVKKNSWGTRIKEEKYDWKLN